MMPALALRMRKAEPALRCATARSLPSRRHALRRAAIARGNTRANPLASLSVIATSHLLARPVLCRGPTLRLGGHAAVTGNKPFHAGRYGWVGTMCWIRPEARPGCAAAAAGAGEGACGARRSIVPAGILAGLSTLLSR